MKTLTVATVRRGAAGRNCKPKSDATQEFGVWDWSRQAPDSDRRNAMITNVLEPQEHSSASEPVLCDIDSTDYDELLRLVENRRARLHLLKTLNAPEIVLRNEQRMLRAAVTAVIEKAVQVCLCPEFSASAGVDPSDPGQDFPANSRR